MTVLSETYTPLELFFYLVGFLLWGVAYGLLVVRIPRQRFVEIPAIAVCGNVTWEFLWGFVWKVEMLGETLQWFYRLGCTLDLFILAFLFRFGAKQMTLPVLRRWFRPLVVGALASWIAFYWTFRAQGYDLPLGSNSAYVVNVLMSAVYIGLALRLRDPALLSPDIGWLKGLGTGMVTVFVFLEYPENRFVQVLGLITGALDAAYMGILYARRRGRLAPPLALAIHAGEEPATRAFGVPVTVASGRAD